MPPTRTLQVSQYRFVKNSNPLQGINNAREIIVVATDQDVVDLAKCNVYYPEGDSLRQGFRTKEGKTVTAHQWAVYDFIRNIPAGKVTTYKDICASIGQGSPRSVGSALRNNPFAPFVPCHRIIASNHYIGGFVGEWGPNAGTGKQYHNKRKMLAQEGVGFDDKGYLVEGESRLWKC